MNILEPCFKILQCLLILDSLTYIVCSSPVDCMKRSTPNCCDDYYEEGTLCKPCIGSFGKNCSGGTCTAGFYGHGCGEQCPCGSLMCDPTRGCPKAIYHHWIYIILGILMINSIPIIIAINVFITVRQRNSLQDQETSEAKPPRNICRHNVCNSFLRCLRRRPSSDEDSEEDTRQDLSRLEQQRRGVGRLFLRCLRRRPSSDEDSEEDTGQDLSRLEQQRRGVGRLNVYVDALLRRVRRTPSNESQREEVPKDDYFVMRLSTAPPKESAHHFTGEVEEENNEEEEEEEYVEMELHSNA
uniref:Uncharacterized protein LOC111137098 n=1 Tax=Crassostrea virginica TaxID=6565 RepID=A0A8B8EVQ4_CRAVI|nr:uncharacterized protein LOC111137098 [Crassostrea virginica]